MKPKVRLRKLIQVSFNKPLSLLYLEGVPFIMSGGAVFRAALVNNYALKTGVMCLRPGWRVRRGKNSVVYFSFRSVRYSFECSVSVKEDLVKEISKIRGYAAVPVPEPGLITVTILAPRILFPRLDSCIDSEKKRGTILGVNKPHGRGEVTKISAGAPQTIQAVKCVVLLKENDYRQVAQRLCKSGLTRSAGVILLRDPVVYAEETRFFS